MTALSVNTFTKGLTKTSENKAGIVLIEFSTAGMKKARKGEKNGREKEGYEETVEKLKKVRKSEELGRETRGRKKEKNED